MYFHTRPRALQVDFLIMRTSPFISKEIFWSYEKPWKLAVSYFLPCSVERRLFTFAFLSGGISKAIDQILEAIYLFHDYFFLEYY